MKIIKRSGVENVFDRKKIENAVKKANITVEEDERLSENEVKDIALDIEERCGQMDRAMDVETIQDWVEADIMKHGKYTVAKHYITYRYERSIVRQANTTDKQILSLLNFENEEVKQENSNKNPTVNSVQRDYMAGEVSKDITKRFLLPDDIVEAHEKGLIHFHDADYFAQHMHNCCLVNLEDMLQNGTVISEVMIEKPHSFSTACNIATQAIAQIASSQYGGQSITLSHLAPFVQISRDKYRKEVRKEFAELGLDVDDETVNKAAEMRVKAEIVQGVQMIQYQVITLMTTNGQAPFVTIFMYLDEVPEGQTRDDLAAIIEEMLRQRIQGVKNEKGVFITPAFPKLIYALDEDNVRESSKYWYLTELAAKCTAKRMVPDYISAKVMRELKGGDVYTCMGCRSFLTPDRFTDKGVPNIAKAKNYQEGKHKYYGRFNQGVVTLNLVDIACSSGKDMEKFWKIFDERLEICRRALTIRHERLKGTASDVAPILWQNGALARLEKGEKIDKLLYDGYSTISLGYAGLCECVRYMTGHSHTDPEATPFALDIMKYLNDACAKWKAETNIDFSIYGTPLESTTYKFARCLQTRFGVIEGVTDKNYITNSYHVHVTEEIDAFDKLKFEAQFQALSPGGAISYVEVPNMQQNIEGVLAVMQYIYDNIMYAELNTKSDYCQVCGYDGEIQIVKEDGKLLWECPNCGNRDQSKLNVARRTCGYIGTQFWNQGRTQEIMDRVMHL
ncbi:MAG: anaerobic ribonucleoside-triphosphate reductase [Ruminococcus sp.]|nr:anaerobic ribonucleoside-triphosphate reductase [Ruminococcus sp.]